MLKSLPSEYAETYDAVVLELQEIEESPRGSVEAGNQKDSGSDPSELSKISVPELLGLVKGKARKYIPQAANVQESRKESTLNEQKGKDTTVLAEGKIQAVSGSNDSLWEHSDDPEKVYRGLGTRADARGIHQKEGMESPLYRAFEGVRGNRPSLLGHVQSIQRDICGRKISERIRNAFRKVCGTKKEIKDSAKELQKIKISRRTSVAHTEIIRSLHSYVIF